MSKSIKLTLISLSRILFAISCLGIIGIYCQSISSTTEFSACTSTIIGIIVAACAGGYVSFECKSLFKQLLHV